MSDLRVRSVPPQANAHAATNERRIGAHCGQNVRGLNLSRGTCGARRNRYAIEVEGNYSSFRLYAANREGARVGETACIGSEDHGFGRNSLQTCFEPVAQRCHSSSVCQFRGSGCCGTKARYRRSVFGSRPLAALLATAPNKRFGHMDVAAAHKGSGALRPANFVRGNADEVGTKLRNVAVDPSGTLHRIDV